MDGVALEEEESSPAPRLRRWPKLKPIQRSSMLHSSDLVSDRKPTKTRVSVDGASLKGLDGSDQMKLVSPEGAGAEEKGERTAYEMESMDAPRAKVTDDDGLAASTLCFESPSPKSSTDYSEQTVSSRAEDGSTKSAAQPLSSQASAQSLCVASKADPAAVELRGADLHLESPGETGTLPKPALAASRMSGPDNIPLALEPIQASLDSASIGTDGAKSAGPLVRSSTDCGGTKGRERRQAKVSESLTCIARLLNEKKVEDSGATPQVRKARPASAYRSNQENNKRESGIRSLRHSALLTPWSTSAQNRTTAKAQKSDQEHVPLRDIKAAANSAYGASRLRSFRDVEKQAASLARSHQSKENGAAAHVVRKGSERHQVRVMSGREENVSGGSEHAVLSAELEAAACEELNSGGEELGGASLPETLVQDPEPSSGLGKTRGDAPGEGMGVLGRNGAGNTTEEQEGRMQEGEDSTGVSTECWNDCFVCEGQGGGPEGTSDLRASNRVAATSAQVATPSSEPGQGTSNWTEATQQKPNQQGRRDAHPFRSSSNEGTALTSTSASSLPAADLDNSTATSARASLSAQKLSSILKYLEEVNTGLPRPGDSPPLDEETQFDSGGGCAPLQNAHIMNSYRHHRESDLRGEELDSEAGYPVDSISTASLEVASKMRGLEGPSSAASEASFLLRTSPKDVNSVHRRASPRMDRKHSSGPVSESGQGPGLVASVYQGVKAKLRALKGEIALREQAIAGLRDEAKTAQEKHTADLKELEARHATSCQRQQAEYEAALARHLAFVDKLLGDKDKLAAKCAQMAADVKAAESKFEERLAAVQEQCAREVKKGREQWAAAEKVKREQWMADKVKEVKDMTIKGLEPQVQRLIEKHKADLQRLEARHVVELRAHSDKLLATQEQEARQQRERLLKEKDDAIEQERKSAQARLREMSERYEQQLILARMRVGSDMAVQIERAEAARRDDKKRHEELLDLKTREGQEREAALRREMTRAVEAAAAEGRAAAEKARAQIAQERSAWESGLQEKVREECARREGDCRKRCDEQMRDELKVVITRMGAEKEEEVERRVSEETERVKQAEKRLEEALRERDELEMRLEKRIQSAVQAKADALQALLACQEQRERLARRTEMEGREIHSLRKQVESLTQKLESSDAEVRERVAERSEQLQRRVREMEAKEEQLHRQLQAANTASELVKLKQAEELSSVESKVRQAIAQRDASVTQLQRQLYTAQQRLREMEQQQRDFLESSM